jgi:hypothetical protein
VWVGPAIVSWESAVPITMKPGTCTVASGQWTDPWSGQVTTDAHALDVPLANAWRSGAWAWDSTRLYAYANDLANADHLNAILLGENRSKGDGGPERWKPPAPASLVSLRARMGSREGDVGVDRNPGRVVCARGDGGDVLTNRALICWTRQYEIAAVAARRRG